MGDFKVLLLWNRFYLNELLWNAVCLIKNMVSGFWKICWNMVEKYQNLSGLSRISPSHTKLARKEGFEPPSPDSKSGVLPLDDFLVLKKNCGLCGPQLKNTYWSTTTSSWRAAHAQKSPFAGFVAGRIVCALCFQTYRCPSIWISPSLSAVQKIVNGLG